MAGQEKQPYVQERHQEPAPGGRYHAMRLGKKRKKPVFEPGKPFRARHEKNSIFQLS